MLHFRDLKYVQNAILRIIKSFKSMSYELLRTYVHTHLLKTNKVDLELIESVHTVSQR